MADEALRRLTVSSCLLAPVSFRGPRRRSLPKVPAEGPRRRSPERSGGGSEAEGGAKRRGERSGGESEAEGERSGGEP
jgi:hypothetical protein